MSAHPRVKNSLIQFLAALIVGSNSRLPPAATTVNFRAGVWQFGRPRGASDRAHPPRGSPLIRAEALAARATAWMTSNRLNGPQGGVNAWRPSSQATGLFQWPRSAIA